MGESVLKKRMVYAGDVLMKLVEVGMTPSVAAKLLASVPSADVSLVVHGVWVRERTVQNPYRGSGTSYYCSVCGRRAGLKFNHPVDENNAELREFITKVNNEIKKALMVDNAGHLVLGTLHLRSNECQAVRVTLVEDDGQYKECEVNG